MAKVREELASVKDMDRDSFERKRSWVDRLESNISEAKSQESALQEKLDVMQ